MRATLNNKAFDAGRAVAPRPPVTGCDGGRRGAPTLPTGARNGGRGTPTLPTGARNGCRGATALPKIVSQFKHLLAVRYGMRFQRDFWDTRLRDDAHYAEKFRYVCNNPVRKGLCVSAREWHHVIAFDRMTGEGKPHR